MNKKEKRTRKKSWRAIRNFCIYAKSMAGSTINDVEKVYVQGKEFDDIFRVDIERGDKLLYEKIISCPNTPVSEIQEMVDAHGPLVHSFESLIPFDSYRYYFGRNTYFNGNDIRIFDILYPVGYHHERFTEVSEKYKKSVVNINYRSCKALLPYLGRSHVNPLDQSWRRVNYYLQYLSLLPNTVEQYDDEKHSEKLVWLCWLEWAKRNPSLCDPLALKLAEHIDTFLAGDKVQPVVKSAYKSVVKAQYSNYVESNAPGGRLHGLIKFSSAQRLNAVIPLLDESTRYPYDGDMEDNSVKELPRAIQSVTGVVLHKLWWSGVVFDEVKVIDNKTLYVSIPIGLSLNMAVEGGTSITFNALNFKEKVEAGVKMPMEDDSIFEKRNAKQQKNIWCIAPIEGKPQYFVNNISTLTKYGENEKMDAIYDAEDCPSVYLDEMMTQCHKQMLKKYKLNELKFELKVGVDEF